MTPVFTLLNAIGSSTVLQELHNEHFGLSAGDAEFWSDYNSSPVFPVSEQPESNNFYITYNYKDSMPFETWWHLNTEVQLTVSTNNIKLMENVFAELRKSYSDYEYAAARLNLHSRLNMTEAPSINWIQYKEGQPYNPSSQENGVIRRIAIIRLNSVVC
jgi:hypothetical protein